MIRRERSRALYANAAIVLALLLLVASIWIVMLERVRTEEHRALETARNASSQVALGFEAHAHAVFDEADSAIVFVRYQYRREGRRLDLDQLVKDAQVAKDVITAILVLDADGTPLLGTGEFTKESRADAEYFTALRGESGDTLFVGKARVHPITGRWVLDVARRIEEADGSFGGVVAVVAEIGRIAHFYRQLKENDSVMIVRSDGIGVVHMSAGAIITARDMSGSTLMKEYEKQPQFGTYISPGNHSGQRRLVSYRDIPGLPVMVAAGSRIEGLLAEVEEHAFAHYVVASVASGALLILALVLMRALARERRDVRRLARDEARFRATFDQSFVGMAQGTPDGRVRQVNKTLCDILGRPESEILSRRLDEFVHGADSSGQTEARDGAPVERRLARKDGSVAWVSIATTEVVDSEGSVDSLVTVVHDISEFKRVDRMKSEFVSTVSHELRTPLTSIRGSLGLLAGGVAGPLPNDARHLVEIARTNSERLIRLISDILDAEKVASGNMSFEPRDMVVEPLLRDAIAANEGMAQQREVGFGLEAPPQPLHASVDPDRFSQVMANLLSNAIKFTEPRSTVRVRLSQTIDRARVEVIDCGPGIPQEFRGRIFEKFSQADSSDTRASGGSGLGLNITKAIVERLGGTIGFASPPGGGTTFWFELPLVDPAAATAAPMRDGRRPCVLICEDDDDIARLVAIMLANAGYDSDIAGTAALARDYLATRRYDAMTVDLKLPDDDGIALIGALRARDRTADLPIVVVSADAEEGRIRINGQERQVSDWLGKPIDESRLIKAVRHAIDGARRPTILHVEPDPDLQCIAAAIVQDFAKLEFASTLQEARALLGRQRFDALILELELPDGPGRELLDEIERLDEAPSVVVFSLATLPMADRGRVGAILRKGRISNEVLRTATRKAIERSNQRVTAA